MRRIKKEKKKKDMKKEKEDLSFDDLWNASEDYISVSNEDLKAATVAAFKKKPNCLYLEIKDFKDVMSIDRSSFIEYANKNYSSDYLDRYITDTVIGEYVIFSRFMEYRGIKVFEIGDDSDVFLLESKNGERFVFTVNETSNVKGVDNQIFFNGWDNMIIYNIGDNTFTDVETR